MNTILISQMVQLFLMIGAGYLLFKLHYLDENLNARLTKLLVDITMPAMAIAAVMNPAEGRDYLLVGKMFFIAAAVYLCLTIVSVILIKLFKFGGAAQGVYMFMFIFSNVGFMGYPVIDALYGDTEMLLAVIINIVFNVYGFTVGVMLINYDAEKKGGIKELIKLLDLKTIITPGTVCSLLAVIIYFIPLTYPAEVKGVIDKIGGLTTPLAMMIIGASLARVSFKSAFTDIKVYIFVFVREIIFPFAFWFVLKNIISDEMIRNVTFILFAMPVASTSSLLSIRYGKDDSVSAKNVFISTALSVISIPIIFSILGVV